MKSIKYLVPEKVKRKLTGSSVFRWYSRRQLYSPDYPKVIGILTGIYPCNYSCRMCPQFSEKPDYKTEMSFDQYKFIIDQLPDDGVRLELASYGETLMVDDIGKMIRYAKEKRSKIPVCMATNGLLLNDEVAEMLIDSKIDIVQVSLNAPERDSFKWLIGIDAYNKASDNIKRFAKRKKELKSRKPEIYTHIINIKELESAHTDKFVKEWNKIVDRADTRPLGNWGGLINENGCTRTWELPKKRYPCAWLWFSTKILPDGEVHKCFVHFLSHKPGIGNINNNTLKNIWEGEKLKAIREKHLQGRYDEEPLCGKCDVWALFPNIFD